MKNNLEFILLTLLLLFCNSSFANDNSTIRQYEYTVERDVVYGTTESYCGDFEDLKLDIFTPINDSNTDRPIMILVHGGAFIGGKSETMDPLSIEFVRRGYVVASVEYRKGFHYRQSPPNTIICAVNPNPCFGLNTDNPLVEIIFSGFNATCGHPYDEIEPYRTIYRAQQDVKGAIRFMKGRNAIDLTDPNKVFLGGASAGGLTVLAAAYMDDNDEKFAAAYAQPNVNYLFGHPGNAGEVATCFESISPCTFKNNYVRPDLGSVDGTLNQNGYDASVKGVVSWFGAVESLDLFDGPNDPPLYIYHQTGDPLVPCGSKTLFEDLYECSINQADYCYNFYEKMPVVHGGCALIDYFENNPQNAPAHEYFIAQTPQFDGHYWDDYVTHAGAVATFFDRVGLDDAECYNASDNCIEDNGLYLHSQTVNWSSGNPTRYLDVPYAVVPDNNGNDVTLKLDYYQAPDLTANNTGEQRPLILFLHSGAFADKNINRKQFAGAGELFVKYGFNVAAIDYRVGWEDPNVNSFCENDYYDFRAANYLALKDVLTAINFLEIYNYATKIDLDNIIVFGYSAGGILAMQSAYMNETTDWESLEGSNLDFNILGELPQINANISAVGSLAGGLVNPDFAFQGNENVPMLLVGGDCDFVVKYDASNVFNCPNYPEIKGNYCVANTANDYGIPYHLRTYKGANHSNILANPIMAEDLSYTFLQFVNDYGLCCKQEQVETIYNSGNSCYTISANNCTSSDRLVTNTVDEIDVNLYPNPTSSQFEIIGNAERYNIEILNTSGQVMSTHNNIVNFENIDIASLPKGMYILKISIPEKWEVISRRIVKQ